MTAKSSKLDDFLPFDLILQNPLRAIHKAGLIVFICLTAGLFVPGILQFKLGTFSKEQILLKLPEDVQAQLKSDELARSSLNQNINKIDHMIASDILSDKTYDAFKMRLQLQTLLESRLRSRKEALYIAPFFPDPFLIVWPLCYISFSFLIFIIGPRPNHSVSNLDTFITFIGVYFYYRWPSWFRNANFIRNNNRKVYAGTNIDVDFCSFLVQEFQALLMSVLLVGVWILWCAYFIEWRNTLSKTYNRSKITKDDLGRLSRSFVRQFIHWQICSAILAAGFIPYTNFFWRYVVVIGDQRYVIQAIVMQSLWLISWLVISLPLALTWYKWQSIRNSHKENAGVKHRNGASEAEEAFEPLDTPLGIINVLVSGVAALFAFITPLLKASLHA